MEISLKNSKTSRPSFTLALDTLMQMPISSRYVALLAEFKDCVDRWSKIYKDTVRAFAVRHGAEPRPYGGWQFVDADKRPMSLQDIPVGFLEDKEGLDEMERRFQIPEYIEIPMKGKDGKDLELPALLFYELREILKEQPSNIVELNLQAAPAQAVKTS